MFYMAGIFPPGVAKSLLGGKFIKRTRLAYQLTAAWIYIMEKRGYENYLASSIGPMSPLKFGRSVCMKTALPSDLLVNFKYLSMIVQNISHNRGETI